MITEQHSPKPDRNKMTPNTNTLFNERPTDQFIPMEDGNDEHQIPPANVIASVLTRAHKNLVKAKNAFLSKIAPRWNRRNRDEYVYVSLDELANANVIANNSFSDIKCSPIDLTVVTAAILIVCCASLIVFSFASLVHYMINNQ